MTNYTAKFTRTESGYTGELIEWPEVITEGRDIDECRAMLKDALYEMILAYRDLGKPVPGEDVIIEPLSAEEYDVRKTA